MQTPKKLKHPKKAMIFAAGLGTRLKPLTNSVPKALARINDITLLEIVIRRLISFGYKCIIINVHHFAGQIIDFLKLKNNFGIEILISDESDLLLDTGGGVQKAMDLLSGSEPVLLHNVDVLTNINLFQMERFHLNQHALATLAVRNRPSSRYLLFDIDNQLCGWKNEKTNELIITVKKQPLKKLAFSGVHFINPLFFQYLDYKGPYSIITKYLELAATEKIAGYFHDNDFWMDLGKPDHLITAAPLLHDFFPEL